MDNYSKDEFQNKLETYLNEIDEVDEQLLNSFIKRLQLIEKCLQANNTEIKLVDKKQPEELITKVLTNFGDTKFNHYITEFLTSYLNISKIFQTDILELQEIPLSKSDITIGFQGVPGSYSEEALLGYFGNQCKTKHYQQFEDVFEALKYEYIDYGILPIENSTTGSITQNFDLLKQYEFYIVGETSVKIQHCLLGLQGANVNEINQVFSHPQGLEQCSHFLKSLPNCKQIAYHNTAISAKHVKDVNTLTNAAIGSKRAGELYDLEALETNISNAKENITRFIIVSKHQESNSLCNKMTLIFTIPHVIGSLYVVLDEFSKEKVNLLKIESRPVGDGSFSYYFYIDIEGNKEDENVKRVFEKVSKVTENFKILGCYKKNI